jgi:hypothetical protein
VVTTGTLINQGTISVLAGAGGGSRTLNAELDNQGTLDIQLSTTLTNTSRTFTTTSGTLTVASGQTLTVNGGTTVVGSGTTQGGTGTVDLTGTHTLTLASDFTMAPSVLNWVLSGAVTINGPGVLTNPETLLLTGDIVNADLVNNGTLLVRQSSALNGALTQGVGSLIRMEGTNGTGQLTVANGFTNTETIELSNVVADWGAELVVTTGTLINQGTISVLAGAGGGSRTLNAELDNQGLLNVAYPLTVNAASADHLNSGTITVSGGNLTVSQSGTTPTFTNAAAIYVTAGQTLAVTGGTFTNNSGAVIGGSGTVNVSSTTFTNLGSIAPGLSAGVLTWTGDLPMGASSLLAIELTGAAVGTEYDQLNVSGTVAFDGTLVVTPTYTPAAGTIFNVLNFGSPTGGFSSVTGRDLVIEQGVGMSLDTSWSAGSLNLVARGQVLFHGGGLAGDGIFRAFGDATTTTAITSEFSLSGNGQPRWSPDYKWVTYGGSTSISTDNYLHIATPDGVTVYHVVNDIATRRARYSALGTHIAFECGARLAFNDVCTVTGVQTPSDGMGDATGASPKVFVTDAVNPVATGPGVFAWNPTVDDQLAVVRDTLISLLTTSAIYTVNYDGSNVSLVAVLPAGETVVGTMDWSPDGTLLAFGAVNQSFATRLYTLDVGSGTLTAITDGSIGDERPVFSPDGSEILFVGGIPLCAANFYAIRPDGSDRRQLTNDDLCDFSTDDFGHDWSPDATWIVLIGATAPPPSGTNPDGVFLVPSSVTTTTYASQRILLRGPAGSVFDIQPSWRP